MSDISPVELTAGPLILYRHFKRMTRHPILVISGDIRELDPPQRHWAVIRLPRRLRWLMRGATRFLFEELRARQIERETREIIDEFNPDLILTVWTGEYLLAAERIARARKLPLALICHDDLQEMLPQQWHVRTWAHTRLKGIYQRAAVRICVSEGMERAFRHRYDAPGLVVYPLGSEPASHVRKPSKSRMDSQLQVGFAGSLGGGNVDALIMLSEALLQIGGRLHISSASVGPERSRLAAHTAVIDCGFFPSTEDMRSYFAKETDAMIVPQSFRPGDRTLVETNFPSKLVEAATLGLAVIVLAPRYASATQWAIQHPTAALTVNSLAPDHLVSVFRSMADPATRQKMSEELRRVASEEFDPDTIHHRFEQALNDIVDAKTPNQTVDSHRAFHI